MSDGFTPGGTFSGLKPVHSSGEIYSEGKGNGFQNFVNFVDQSIAKYWPYVKLKYMWGERDTTNTLKNCMTKFFLKDLLVNRDLTSR